MMKPLQVNRVGTMSLLGPNHRYLRVVLDVGGGSDGMEDNTSSPPILRMPECWSITSQSQSHRFPPVGECIYCYSKPSYGEPALTEEHILAEGLGGRFILPEASCKVCEKRTCKLEGAVLRTSLFAARAQLKVRGKKRARENLFPLTLQINGVDTAIELPLESHPTMLFMCGLYPPRLVAPRPRETNNIRKLWVHTFGHPNVAVAYGARGIASPSFDTLKFAQMLAKIAHATAVARFGLNRFEPYLRDFILREFGRTESNLECFDLIGGVNFDYAPSDCLHQIGHEIIRQNGKICVAILIRLFASLGAPLYSVIAGELI